MMLLTEDERGMLRDIRDRLRSGAIVYFPLVEGAGKNYFIDISAPAVAPLKFNMRHIEVHVTDDADHDCGTACCVLGLMRREAYARGIPEREWEYDLRLNKLFYPSNGVDYNLITPAQAADAIDDVLADRDPHWSPVAHT